MNKKIIISIIGVILLIALAFLLVKGCSKEYIVTFDSDGGSEVKEVKVKENEKLTKPEDPTKENYEFAGWFLDDKEYDFNEKVTKDFTLKAHWSNTSSDSIILDTSNIDLATNETGLIVVKSLPDGYSTENLIWESSDNKIAKVDENGLISAISPGTVTITVTTTDGLYKATCEITINKKRTESKDPVELKKLLISGPSNVMVGSKIKLTAVLVPSYATEKNITWSSSDSTIATVDNSGQVTGKKIGKVTITATASNGQQATKSIIVNDTYTIKFTAEHMGEGGMDMVLRYKYNVYQGNKEITDYKGFKVGSAVFVPGGYTAASQEIKSRPKKTTITLTDNTIVTANIVYVD